MKLPLGARVLVRGWQPSRWEEKVIEREFWDLIAKLCGSENIIPTLEVRSPCYHQKWLRGFSGGDAGEWHQDRANSEYRLYVAAWANQAPTEVALTDGSMLFAEDGDVILIDNEAVRHRISETALALNERWFARAYLKKRK